MESLYIIDPTNFNGRIINTMRPSGYVDYMDKPTTLDQYKEQKGNKNLISLTWEDFDAEYYTPYLDSLCGKFKRTTKELYRDALECLPPKRWTFKEDRSEEFFFIGECTTANLYSCYVRKGKKYFTALRPITAKIEDIFELK